MAHVQQLLPVMVPDRASEEVVPKEESRLSTTLSVSVSGRKAFLRAED